MLHPNPDLVFREVSRIYNAKHIATKMMQSYIFPPEIIQEMDAADHHANWEIAPSALYTRAVTTLMNRLNGIIEVGAMHGVCMAGVCVAILNMNLMSNMNVLEPPCRVPQILLSPLQRQSTLPHELSLRGTRIPDANLDMGMDGRTRSEYFAGKSVKNPFVAILMTPRLFPRKILDTKV